ncbi:hypothetical protein R1flu_001585 [Riccia fluitans]|uniref:DCD domain-containing protein n=1 Tax=Riccia fluitans TaxID=41844 RepID=A0ABD1Y457_9MARC
MASGAGSSSNRQAAQGSSLACNRWRSPTVNQRWENPDIGSVIFGCSDITFEECLERNLFGLPGPHFSYVRAIRRGMLVFLFNYSNRKLYGVFVAVTAGEQNIDPYAWTDGALSKTRFPAQVRVTLKADFELLISLEENDFKPIIEENYYASRRFCFDLNRPQTYYLIKKFETARDCLKLIRDALGERSGSSCEGAWNSTPKFLLPPGAAEPALNVCAGEGERRLRSVVVQERRRDGRLFYPPPGFDDPPYVPTFVQPPLTNQLVVPPQQMYGDYGSSNVPFRHVHAPPPS